MQFGLIEAVRHWAKYRGNKVALISNGQQTTYRDLFLGAERVAQIIRDSGVNGRVAVAAQRKAAFMTMLLGVMCAGRSAVVLNTCWDEEVLSVTVKDTKPEVLLQDHDLANTWSQSAFTNIPRVTVDSFQGDVHRDVPWPKRLSDSEWGVLFSSGSTGIPKGIERDHNSMITEIIGWCLELPLTKHSVFYIGRPLFYTGGLVLSLASLFVGANIIANDYRDDDDPEEVWSDYQKMLSVHGVEWAFFMPDQLRAFVAMKPTNPGHSKFILVMGAPISGSEKIEARSALGSQVVESWGNSEALGTITEPEDLDLRPDSVGRPFVTDELCVVDDSLNPCNPGEIGRIAGAETAGFQEYSNRPDTTRQVKQQDLIISDDVGCADKDGYFYVSGRVQDWVVKGDISLFLPNIAEKIRTQPYVGAVEVCAVDVEGNVHLCAAIVLANETTAKAEEVRQKLNACLNHQEVLSRVLVLDVLPKLASGKVDRLAVRRRFEEHG